MKEIEKIKLPIKKEMDLFEVKFSKSMNSKIPLLNRITHYVVCLLYTSDAADD